MDRGPGKGPFTDVTLWLMMLLSRICFCGIARWLARPEPVNLQNDQFPNAPSRVLRIPGQVWRQKGVGHPEKGRVRKHVWFFLTSGDFEPLVLKKSGGLDDAKWFRLQDIIELNFYDDMLPIVTAAVQKLLDHSSR